MKHILYYCLFAFLLSCSGGSDKTASDTQKPVIVTTTGMIGDAVKNLVGDRAEVIPLMGPGVDPHLYKATQGDLERLQNADVIVYNGIHLEGKMSEILEKLASKKVVIAMSDGISTNKLRLLDAGSKVYDPHIWFDVALWKDAVAALAKTLAEKQPALEETISKNSIVYLMQLDSLHQDVKKQMAEIPKAQRVLITAHDAFGYFGLAYDTEVKGLQGISTVSDFGLNDVTQLVNLIVERKIKSVFVETSVSDQSIKAVLDGCRQKGHNIAIGGTLFSDAMGAAGTPEVTYEGMVRKNVATIVAALK
ncbi:metal ABC transporter solute-binding protein, Zn/Mn family [Cytophaga hutchinsonii]|uniref:Mn/Zn ABC transporter, substrate-binding protein n=1 Tax=Cytophaga hutchinsonii (strain ATCC 33406 / DSM 1761 / CIP 103989 / NBRC 15051 / NCIMB 9469 / D465) TaxID=269798 RepID=A0A6N4SSB9_CYTH3|nr:zinc ABC transporter substrate-binding protein [Cytophaga hutchinsonii]ABG59291.1 Mn/Zn ABC transporter, substrate-binding protein [Cytophaga hutchinsonii ATCC 33406]SFX32488.1 manganese/zinc/iron transport system substrate-binding protein [Cytophaga hutchinsonii ATCC 33406]